MKPDDLDASIDACLEGRLSETEAERLGALLEESAGARARYWELASIHGLLEQSLQNASLNLVTGKAPAALPVRSGIFARKPIAAAAAGLVAGIFGATMVWAYTGSMSRSEIREEVLFESFEGEAPEALIARFPDRAGEWFGNVTTAQPPGEGRDAVRGDSVGRWTPVPTRRFAYAWHIIDLAEIPSLTEGDSRQLEVVASFASDRSSGPVHYQIRLAAFSEAPEKVRPLWNDEDRLYDTVLQHVGRNHKADLPSGDWKKLYARLDIPPGARSLVISLGVAGTNGALSGRDHFVDAVRARIISSREIRD